MTKLKNHESVKEKVEKPDSRREEKNERLGAPKLRIVIKKEKLKHPKAARGL